MYYIKRDFPVSAEDLIRNSNTHCSIELRPLIFGKDDFDRLEKMYSEIQNNFGKAEEEKSDLYTPNAIINFKNQKSSLEDVFGIKPITLEDAITTLSKYIAQNNLEYKP